MTKIVDRGVEPQYNPLTERNILKRKNFGTLRKCKFLLIDSKFSFGDITILSYICLAYNMKIRTPRLMVAEKTSKLDGNQFLKDTLHYKLCENEISTKGKKDNKLKYGQQLQKSKKDNKRNTSVLEWEFLSDCAISWRLPTFTFSCLGRRLLRVCCVFKFDVVCF